MSLRLCIIKPLKSGHPYKKDSLGMSQSVRIIGVPLYIPNNMLICDIVLLQSTPIKHDLVSSLGQEESISNFTVFRDEFSIKDLSTESHLHLSQDDV